MKVPTPFTSKFSDVDEIYHPNSYYVRGGIDVTGKALALDGQPKYDDEASISGEVQAAAMCDPRRNFIDLVEALGADEAHAVVLEASTQSQSDDHTTE